MRPRLRLAATAVLALLAASVPSAAAGASGEPRTTASASVKKKVKKLMKRVTALEQRLADQDGGGGGGGTGPPAGPAGGALRGTYPNPLIAAGAVESDEVPPDALTGDDIDESTFGTTPSGPAGAGLAGSYPNPGIAPNAVGSLQIANNSVTTNHVGQNTLGAADLASNSVFAQELGGVTVRSDEVIVPGNTGQNGNYNSEQEAVNCQIGEQMISGGAGWLQDTSQDLELMVVASRPSGNGWFGRGASDVDFDATFQVYALCLPEAP